MKTADDLERAIRDRLSETTRPGLCLYRSYPPIVDRPGRSKLGGLPTLPESVEWPYGVSYYGTDRRSDPGKREPMTFLAQIDCADLPDGSDPLPGSGMLFFFMALYGDVWDGDPREACRVIYVEDVPQSIRPRAAPDDLPRPPYYTLAHDVHLADDPLAGRVYREWPLLPALVESYPDNDLLEWNDLQQMMEAMPSEAFDETRYLQDDGIGEVEIRVREKLYAAQVASALGIEDPLAMAKGWRNADPSKDFYGADHAEAFPFAANVVSEIAAAVIQTCNDKKQRAIGRSPEAPDWFAESDRIIAAAQEWLDGARGMARDAKPDNAARSAFRAWISGLQDASYKVLKADQAVTRGMLGAIKRSATHPGLRAAIPDAVYAHHFHDVTSGLAYPHQMLGFFPSCQMPRPMDDPLVPLLSLQSDNAASMMFGDMGEMQFFISEDALAARDFDKVIGVSNSC